MHKGFVTVKLEVPGTALGLTGQLLNELKLQVNDEVAIKCGSASATATVIEITKKSPKNQIMGLSQEVLEALHIPAGVSFHIKQPNNKTIRLGPVIGILTFPGHIPGRLGYYRSYAARNKDNGLFFVFRGRNVNPKTQTINGYYYDHSQKKWLPGEFPYPDAVNDRCYPNPYIIHNRLERVIGPNKIFNKKTMINKFQFWRALKDNPFLKEHTPRTRLFTETQDLVNYLDQYGQVFLKPTNGMKGWGIVVAAKNDDGFIECQYNVKGKVMRQTIADPQKIWSVLRAAAGRKRPYIIQQAIDRMKYEEGPFSIRTWAMKNGEGKWVIPGMFAKVGEGFLTNFTAGAKLVPLQSLFDSILPRVPYDKEKLLNLIEKITLDTARALDEHYGPLGELGFDIVFSTDGKPWVIEANGNPGNIPIFIQKEYPLWRHLIFIYPVQYATYLAGFKE